MARAENMMALTYDVWEEWPGTTVWGKGDLAHQGSPSDHNEDDTPGSRPEQTDADNNPEHRAIDIPFLGPFNLTTARTLRARLTTRPVNQRRLKYVILEQTIWRRNGGWVAEHYNGEYHNHLHVSGYAPDDENGSGWDIGPDVVPTPPSTWKDEDMAVLFHTIDDQGTQIGTDDEAIFAIVGGGGCWVADGQVPQSLANKLAVPPSAPDHGFGNSSGLTKAEWNALMDMYDVEGHRFAENADGTLGDWVA